VPPLSLGGLQPRIIYVCVAEPVTLVGSDGKSAAIIDRGVEGILDPTELVA